MIWLKKRKGVDRVFFFFFLLFAYHPTSKQSVSQGPICLDNCACCNTEIDVADQTDNVTLSQYIDASQTV